MHVDWGAAATVFAVLLTFYFANRRDVKKRHDENVKAWQQLQTDLEFLPPHQHVEEAGSLTVVGIRYRPERRS